MEWTPLFEKKVREIATSADPAHDFLHFKRVAKTAEAICASENGRLEIVLPAAWLHDFVLIPKNDPRRSQASRLSAASATQFLRENAYPEEFLAEIGHAIEAHSFSAGIEARSLEAKIVQDADRLDGLGAIGIARCFAPAGLLQRPFYSEADPFCDARAPDDRLYTLDHFFVKLFRTAETLQTQAGQAEGKRRMERMRKFLDELREEI